MNKTVVHNDSPSIRGMINAVSHLIKVEVLEMNLGNLSPAKGSIRKRKRIGRGNATGQGRTAGKGHNGYKSRSGASSRLHFEGGQTPLMRRLPKRGFSNYLFKKNVQIVNLDRIQSLGLEKVDVNILIEHGVIKKANNPVKILGHGDISSSVEVSADMFSKSAVQKLRNQVVRLLFMIDKFLNIFRIPDLRKKLIFTSLLILVYRLGGMVPVPGVDRSALAMVMQNFTNSLLGLYDMFAGGFFSQASIFALGIMPYISASIIIQLLGAVVPYFQRLQKEGEEGRKKITQITRYGTVLIATLQSVGVAVFLQIILQLVLVL